MEQPKKVLLPMGIGDILDETFRMYKNNFLVFVGIIAVIEIPIAVVGFFTDLESNYLVKIVWLGVSVIIMGMIYPLMNAVLTRAISRRYMGEQIQIMNSYKFLKGKVIMFILTSLTAGVLIGLGFIALIFPGIILALRYALISPVMALEGKTGMDALKRSSELMKKNQGKYMLLLLIMMGLALVIVMCVGIPFGILNFLLLSREQMPAESSLPLLMAAIINFITRILQAVILTPVWMTAMTLFYYDVRVRKEGFDMEMLSNNLSGNPVKMPEPTQPEQQP